MPTIAFVHTKGGVGKTTSAIHVSCELQRRGFRTLLVDCDHTTRGASSWGRTAAQAGNHLVTVTSAAHVKFVADLAADYEWTVVDSRPATIDASGELDDDLFLETLWVADFIAISVLPSPLDLWNMGSTLKLLQRAMKLKPSLRAGLFINMFEPGVLESRDTQAAIGDWGIPVLPNLNRLTDFKRAFRFGQGLPQWKPRSPAARQIRDLTEEILRHVQNEQASPDDALRAATG